MERELLIREARFLWITSFLDAISAKETAFLTSASFLVLRAMRSAISKLFLIIEFLASFRRDPLSALLAVFVTGINLASYEYT